MATDSRATVRTTPPGATPSERAAIGKAERARGPRSAHGDWEPAADRPSPVDVLEAQDPDRVPELVPLRYGRMLVSAFTFYRGAAAIMAADLAATPDSGLWVQACGDAHLSNFGAYAAPSRDLVVDINDFDETAPGPWEWDLKRLAASFEIARPRPWLRRCRAPRRGPSRCPQLPGDHPHVGRARQSRGLVSPAGRIRRSASTSPHRPASASARASTGWSLRPGARIV